MADISEWSPLDESNTSAPPNGWPEFMSVSGVNNSARAMMGAVRRWYDEVLEQIAAIEASLANRLPLTGGSLSGELFSTSNISTSATLTAGGGIVSYTYIQATTSVTAATVSANNIFASGNMSAANLTTSASISAGSWVDAPQYRLAGVPIEFTALFAEVEDLQARVRALEARR